MGRRTVEREDFGRLQDGRIVTRFTLDDGHGVRASFLDFGATLQSLWTPGRDGAVADVILGFDDLEGYLGPHPYFGGTVGRVANRIANARFTLDGVTHVLTANDGAHALHGGRVGFDRQLWQASVHDVDGAPELCFALHSAAGDQGFPGDVDVLLRVALVGGALELREEIRSSERTPVALTAHPYFRLCGTGVDSILEHVLRVDADVRLPTDAALIPTGEIRAVDASPFDLRRGSRVGDAIAALGRGFDDCWLLRSSDGALALAASLFDPHEGRRLEVWTTKPALQVYTGNFLDGSIVGKRGTRYGKHAGLCLEAQYAPNAVNEGSFASPIVMPDCVMRHVTRYVLSK